jgi:hypothetical protein
MIPIPKKSDFTIRKFFIDDINYLQIKSNDKLIHLKLILVNDKPRKIGTVTKSTRTIAMKRKRGVHLFRKLNAFGFNDFVLREQNCVDWVRLSDDTGTHWKIPVKYILENGVYMNFKKEGFELQRFVSLEQLEQFRVKDSENRRF